MEKTPTFTFTDEECRDTSLMVSYNFSSEDKSFLGFEANGTEYIYLDNYCKNPNCDCTIVLVDIFERANLKDTVTSFFYDYTLNEIVEETTPIPQFIKDELTSIEGLNDTLRKRNQAIRQGFSEFMIKRNHLKGQQFFPAKVGRNEPCPCGSGKKYKKCCGA